MTDTHSGSCLCGGVRFEIRGHFEHFFLCHCSRCRRGSGSAHGANLFSTAAEITWLSGQALIKTFTVPNTRHQRSFCATCGAALPRTEMDGALLVTPAGSLDTALDMRPDAHICVASSVNWDEASNATPRLEGLPS